MQTGSPSKKQHEVWKWFVSEEALTGKKAGRHKGKVYCLQCLNVHLEALRTKDDELGVERADRERYDECE